MSGDVEGLLELARQQAQHGQLDEATELFRRFHDDSRSHAQLSGTRLSVALSAWAELARRHPPAMAALLDARERTSSRLRSGRLDDVPRDPGAMAALDDFTEVTAISTRLGDEGYLVALFLELDRDQPELALVCASAARRFLVRAEQYAVAHRYLDDPDGTVTRSASILEQRLTRGFGHLPEQVRTRMRQDTMDDYLHGVEELVAILTAVGQPEQALRVRHRAVEAIGWAHVRDDVASALGESA